MLLKIIIQYLTKGIFVILADLRENRKEKERTGATERRGDKRKKEKTDPLSSSLPDCMLILTHNSQNLH